MIPSPPPHGKCADARTPGTDPLAALASRINELLDRGIATNDAFRDAMALNRTLREPLPPGDVLELLARLKSERESAPPAPEVNNGPGEEEYVLLTLSTPKTPSDYLRAASPARSPVGEDGKNASEEETRKACLADMKAGRGFRVELRPFLAWACEYSREMRKRSPGWQSPLFWFVRALRGHPSLALGTAQPAAGGYCRAGAAPIAYSYPDGAATPEKSAPTMTLHSAARYDIAESP